MKHAIAIFVSFLVAMLGLADAGQAQPPASVQVQGTIRAVDCQAYTVSLDTAGGSGVYRTAASAAISVNSTGVPFCALQQYPGASANVWLTATGNELVITRIDAAGQASAPTPPAAAPYAPAYTPPPPATYAPAPYAPAYTPPSPATYAPAYVPTTPVYYPQPYYAPPLVGVVLGTIVVAGLIYLLVRHPGGVLYRYPYYGHYYRTYYRPFYRPYYGPLVYSPHYIYGPYRWCPGLRAWGYWCR